MYGGVPKWQQIQDLNKGVEVVVATPGRLLDLINEGACHLESVSYLVLDEADRCDTWRWKYFILLCWIIEQIIMKV